MEETVNAETTEITKQLALIVKELQKLNANLDKLANYPINVVDASGGSVIRRA
jgi:uncharacterized FlaG/YvyC family protein